MTEFLSPGVALPHIPDDLTLVQFVLDSTHECRPIRPQGSTWLVEDATGRRIGLGEVTILPVVCASVWTLTSVEDTISCIWLGKRDEYEMGYQCVFHFCNYRFPSDSQNYSGENDVGM